MKKIYFFIGTEAEFIKLFPVMLEFNKRNISYGIIASGQNDIKKSKLLTVVGTECIQLELSQESTIKKTSVGLFSWWFKTFWYAKKVMRISFSKEEMHAIMIVHGDTVSTVMGAILGKKLGMQVAHIEAGLRSHHWLNPFPEEIDRMLTSHFVDFHFAPGQEAEANLKRRKGDIINTEYNTIYDSLLYSKRIAFGMKEIESLLEDEYCVFILHRQENVSNHNLVEMIVKKIIHAATERRCILLLHKLTEIYLRKYGLFDTLKESSGVILIQRLDYFDFMKILDHAEYVVTDGGSNQEELSYMGKPCLIIREATERKEGLGENALLWKKSEEVIDSFIINYKSFIRQPLYMEVSPAKKIVDYIIEQL